MTRTEQAEMAELKMDEETLAQRQAKVSAMINGVTSYSATVGADSDGDIGIRPPAPAGYHYGTGKWAGKLVKNRSDAGKKRTPEPVAPATAGKLRREERIVLDGCVGRMIKAREEMQRAIEAHDRAQMDYEKCLDSLTQQ